MELVLELKDAGRRMSKVEMKRTLLRGLRKDIDTPAEFIVSIRLSYAKVLSRVMVRETQLDEMETMDEKAFISQACKTTKLYYN